jgi:LacI family gluconate utilization system Gnt-I transcriptional repressor
VLTADGRRAQTRHAGFAAVMHDAGMREIQQIIVPAPTTFTQGRQGLANFLNAGGAADVVVCSSDWMAHGVIAEAHSRQMRIPEDLAVIGFGNMDFAADVHPALTTVHIDGAHIGRQAAGLLLQRSQGIQPAERIVDVGFNIVERASG